MKKNEFLSLLLFASMVSFSWFANAEDAKKPELLSCDTKAVKCVNTAFRSWMKKNNHQSKDYIFGKSAALFSKNSPQYADALSKAYEGALLDAYSEVAKKQAQENIVRISQELLSDNRKNPEENKPVEASKTQPKNKSWLDKTADFMGLSSDEKEELSTEMTRLAKKVESLAEATLDEKLKELGQDPNNFKNCSVKQKRIKLRNAIESQAIQKAAAETSSMLPAQTFTACGTDGECAVGVAISTKLKTFRLIQDIQRYGSQYKPDKTKADGFSKLTQKIDDNGDFSNDFGVRLMYDKEGYPVFVSFGQSSINPEGGEDFYSTQYKVAEEFAKSNASMYLSTLYNSYVTYNSEAKIGAVKQRTEEKEKNTCESKENTTTTATTEIGKVLNQYVDLKSNTNITGITPLYTWDKDYGQTETVGVILMWSPKTAQEGEDLKNHTETSYNNSETNKKSNSEQSFITEGMNLDEYDF